MTSASAGREEEDALPRRSRAAAGRAGPRRRLAFAFCTCGGNGAGECGISHRFRASCQTAAASTPPLSLPTRRLPCHRPTTFSDQRTAHCRRGGAARLRHQALRGRRDARCSGRPRRCRSSRSPGHPAQPALRGLGRGADQFLYARDYLHFATFLMLQPPRPGARRDRGAPPRRRRQPVRLHPQVVRRPRVLRAPGDGRLPRGGLQGVLSHRLHHHGPGHAVQRARFEAGRRGPDHEHDHYSTHESLRLKSARSGARCRRSPVSPAADRSWTRSSASRAGVGPGRARPR